MILTDREIRSYLAARQIELEPAPDTFEGRLSSTALDLLLGAQFDRLRRPDLGTETVLNPQAVKARKILRSHLESVQSTEDDKSIVLKSGDFVLAWTQEKVHLHTHARIAARVEGKSSLARFGVGIHVTAPTIHAGFSGRIQLEVFHHGPIPVRLTPGMPICQLIFEMTLGTPEAGYEGQFQGQISV